MSLKHPGECLIHSIDIYWINERCSTSPVIREMQIKTPHQKMANIENIRNKCYEDVQKGTLVHCWKNIHLCNHYGKQYVFTELMACLRVFFSAGGRGENLSSIVFSLEPLRKCLPNHTDVVFPNYRALEPQTLVQYQKPGRGTWQVPHMTKDEGNSCLAWPRLQREVGSRAKFKKPNTWNPANP